MRVFLKTLVVGILVGLLAAPPAWANVGSRKPSKWLPTQPRPEEANPASDDLAWESFIETQHMLTGESSDLTADLESGNVSQDEHRRRVNTVMERVRKKYPVEMWAEYMKEENWKNYFGVDEDEDVDEESAFVPPVLLQGGGAMLQGGLKVGKGIFGVGAGLYKMITHALWTSTIIAMASTVSLWREAYKEGALSTLAELGKTAEVETDERTGEVYLAPPRIYDLAPYDFFTIEVPISEDGYLYLGAREEAWNPVRFEKHAAGGFAYVQPFDRGGWVNVTRVVNRAKEDISFQYVNTVLQRPPKRENEEEPMLTADSEECGYEKYQLKSGEGRCVRVFVPNDAQRKKMAWGQVVGPDLLPNAIVGSSMMGLTLFPLSKAGGAVVATAEVAGLPMRYFQQILARGLCGRLFSSYLQAFVGMQVSFQGWEAGQYLTEMGRMLFTDRDDIEKSRDLYARILRKIVIMEEYKDKLRLAGKGFENDEKLKALRESQEEDQILLKRLYENMFFVLWSSEGLLTRMWQGLVQQRYETLEYHTFISFISTAGIAQKYIVRGETYRWIKNQAVWYGQKYRKQRFMKGMRPRPTLTNLNPHWSMSDRLTLRDLQWLSKQPKVLAHLNMSADAAAASRGAVTNALLRAPPTGLRLRMDKLKLRMDMLNAEYHTTVNSLRIRQPRWFRVMSFGGRAALFTLRGLASLTVGLGLFLGIAFAIESIPRSFFDTVDENKKRNKITHLYINLRGQGNTLSNRHRKRLTHKLFNSEEVLDPLELAKDFEGVQKIREKLISELNFMRDFYIERINYYEREIALRVQAIMGMEKAGKSFVLLPLQISIPPYTTVAGEREKIRRMHERIQRYRDSLQEVERKTLEVYEYEIAYAAEAIQATPEVQELIKEFHMEVYGGASIIYHYLLQDLAQHMKWLLKRDPRLSSVGTILVRHLVSLLILRNERYSVMMASPERRRWQPRGRMSAFIQYLYDDEPGWKGVTDDMYYFEDERNPLLFDPCDYAREYGGDLLLGCLLSESEKQTGEEGDRKRGLVFHYRERDFLYIRVKIERQRAQETGYYDDWENSLWIFPKVLKEEYWWNLYDRRWLHLYRPDEDGAEVWKLPPPFLYRH